MIGKKSVEHFVGKWRIHSIMNLTTFDRIHSALQRRGTLPLEKLLLAQNPPVEKPLAILPDDFPIRKNRLMKSQIDAVTRVCHDLDEENIYCIHGPPGTGKTTTLLEMIYTLCRRANPGEIILTGTCNTTVRDLVCRIMAPGSDILPPGGYLMVVGHEVQIEREVHQYALFNYLSRTIKVMHRVYLRLGTYLRQLERNAGFDQLDKTKYQREKFDEWLKKMEKLPCKPKKIMKTLIKLRDIWEDMWTDHVLKQITGEPSDDMDQVKDILKDCIKEVEQWCNPITLTPILIQNSYLVACTNSQGTSDIQKNWPYKYILQDEAAQCIELNHCPIRQNSKK